MKEKPDVLVRRMAMDNSWIWWYEPAWWYEPPAKKNVFTNSSEGDDEWWCKN